MNTSPVDDAGNAQTSTTCELQAGSQQSHYKHGNQAIKNLENGVREGLLVIEQLKCILRQHSQDDMSHGWLKQVNPVREKVKLNPKFITLANWQYRSR